MLEGLKKSVKNPDVSNMVHWPSFELDISLVKTRYIIVELICMVEMSLIYFCLQKFLVEMPMFVSHLFHACYVAHPSQALSFINLIVLFS